MAENVPGVLYLEGSTDFDLLKAWAMILDHPLKAWFIKLPFWHNNKGRSPKEAKAHYFALRAVRPELLSVLLLDGDNRNLPDREIITEGLSVLRWERYEAESYLLHPETLTRFIGTQNGELFANAALAYLRDQIPPAFFKKPLETSTFLKSEPASKTLLPQLFAAADVKLTKSEYFLIAQQMTKEEIPKEVEDKLDAIRAIVCP